MTTFRRGLAALALALSAFPALAAVDGGPGTGNAFIAYRGTLERHGTPVDGTAQFRIGLFTSGAAGTSSCLASTLATCGAWADQFDAVPVHGGAFSVMLGSGAVALPDSVFANQDALYVGVAVGDGLGGWAVLGGLQRLVAGGYAVRAERARDFNVGNALTVGNGLTVTGGNVAVGIATPARKLHVENGEVRVRASTNAATPDIAQFYANNLTQGVGISYASVEAIGSNADQDLAIKAKGAGKVRLDSTSVVMSTRVDETGATATYNRSMERLLYVANYDAAGPVHSYTPIPASVLASRCGDEDGCRITLRMRNWASGATNQTATSFSLHFAWGTTDAATGRTPWRREEVAASSNPLIIQGPAQATDGDGVVDHVLRNHDCYFTDGTWTRGSATTSDAANSGMGLLNYNTGGYTATCELVIDD